jgi:hypothetical protein
MCTRFLAADVRLMLANGEIPIDNDHLGRDRAVHVLDQAARDVQDNLRVSAHQRQVRGCPGRRIGGRRLRLGGRLLLGQAATGAADGFGAGLVPGLLDAGRD